MRMMAGVTAALAVALASGCAHTRVATVGDPESLERRERAFFAAMAERDADRVAAFFDEQAVLHVADMPPIEGREAIHRFYGNVFRFLSATTPRPETLAVAGSGDLAYGTGSVANEFRGPDGPVEYRGKYVLVWRWLAGEWRVVLYGISGNEPSGGR